MHFPKDWVSLKGASFWCEGSTIFIHNRHPLGHAYSCWTIAAVLVAVPFLRHLTPPGTTLWLVCDEGWGGLIVYLLSIFLAVSAGFWWSTIRVDLDTRIVEKRSRWGLFRGRTTTSLGEFSAVEVGSNSDGDAWVVMTGSQDLRVVWGRTASESAIIARELAARLGLPLRGDCD